jgi:hypothetical protein
VTNQSLLGQRLAVPLTSLIIATVLTLQASVTFRAWLRSLSLPPSLTSMLSPPTLWPFVDYPMYSRPHYEGEPIAQFRISGTLEDGTEVWIKPGDVGLDAWHFSIHFVRGLGSNDAARVKDLVRLYQARHNRRLVGLRLENHPLILSRDGIRPGPPEVRQNLSFEARKL